MTRDEAEDLLKHEPGVCVGSTAFGESYIYRCSGVGFEYYNDLLRTPTWMRYGKSLKKDLVYTRVKNPELCCPAENSPWHRG